MGKSKQKTQQTSTYQYMTPPENQYSKTAAQYLNSYDTTGAVREANARNINDINNGGNEFLGANTPDYVRDQVRQERLFRNNTNLGHELAQARSNDAQMKTGGYLSLGGLNAPQLVQSGGTADTTMTKSPFDIAMGVGGLAAA